jgi:uncharacterized protein (DUF4415 family)
MSKKPDPEKVDDENPEWTDETTAQSVKFGDLSSPLQRKLSKGRGPQRSPTKVQTAVRYDQDVIEHFRAAGRGWQTRMNDALRRAIEKGLA